MSEPKRYTDLQVWEALYFAGSTNGWIRWEDYARLKAEVERLTAEVSYDNRVQLHVDKLAAEFTQSEVERLKAEVERLTERLNRHLEINDELDARCTRLRKAGDAMVLKVPDMMAGCVRAEEAIGLMNDWIAAKEGKQS